MKKLKEIYFLGMYLISLPLNFIKRNKISSKTRISSNAKISRSEIGKYCYIANNTNIINAKIGNYTSIAPGVQIGGMEHSYWWHSTSTFLSDQCESNKRTIIEDDVWIAAGSVIKQGVKIGRGSVIGAMSFVNKDVPENSIVVGIPAKFLKKRMNEEIFAALSDTEFWLYSPHKAKNLLNNI